MNKTELLQAVAAKPGFVRIASDNLAQDTIQGDPVQKRYLSVEHNNTDGTAGITHVFYLQDTSSNQDEKLQTVKYYNVEPASFDVRELTAEAKKQAALETYLKGKYAAYFLGRVDLTNNWAEADVFTLNAGTLTRKSVLVYKQGGNRINDIDVVVA